MDLYRLAYASSAGRDIKKLPKDIKLKLKIGLELLVYNPIKLSKKLVNHPAEYRYRIGDYRVLFNIENGNILVLKVRHRRDAYRR